MAILELTKQNLVEWNFPEDEIEKLLTWDNYVCILQGDTFASNIDMKIYTERDYYTHTYNGNSKPIFPFNCLDLIPEYYNTCLKKYLNDRNTLLGSSFVERAEKEIFKLNEIKEAETVINNHSNLFKSRPETFEKHSAVIGKQAYKTWLESGTEKVETKTEQETPTFINNFDKINPTEIHKHFKAGFVEKGYLTEQELNEFLKAAFELKTIPETLFKIKDAPNKATIEAVFYKYYKNVAGKIHGKQNQYAALLGDYFEGYKTTTVSSNFSKSVY